MHIYTYIYKLYMLSYNTSNKNILDNLFEFQTNISYRCQISNYFIYK